MEAAGYPWYQLVTGDDIQQGDILENCPVPLLPLDSSGAVQFSAPVEWEKHDVIVLSQTCDLMAGHERVTDVMVSRVWLRKELTHGHLASNKGMEEARRGNLPGFHVLAACDLVGLFREVRIVDFRKLFSLPLRFVHSQATAAGHRIRLLPPYREHLAQAFARFFMRVGLPVDIPPFR